MKLELTCHHGMARAKFALVFALAAVPFFVGSTASADQVIPDDLIVQGSACIGLDCVNNESFGFDTLRLKENNTRIKFDDTSTAGGFPANDWTLVANDSASGGRNFFGIEDTTAGRMIFGVSAGAPTASLWVNSLGNVGLGTENPLLKLHLSNADTPGIRLEQTNAGGFTAQTWDVAGNEANFFIRDVTGGNKLPFRIRPGAPTSSIDIASNGFVGFGTAAPTAQLHTTGTIRFEGLSGCGGGLATDAQGYLSCLVGGGSSLVQQAAPGQPITVGAATDGTQVAVNGTAGNRTVTGVLAGTVAAGSTDAIVGGQLYTANQRVAAAFGGGAGLDGSGQLTAPSYTVQGNTYNNVGGAVNALDLQMTQLTTNGTRYFQSNSTGPGASATGTNANAVGSGSSSSGLNSIAVGTGAQATQSGSIAVGFNSSSTGLNSIAIGTGATATGSVAVGAGASAANGGAAYGDGAVATGSLSTAVGPNASATAANAVAIGSGSTNTVANTVSFGSAGNERRLTNVAAGISQTDAVNVGQLQSVAAGFQSQLGNLQTQINDTRTEARGGVALALAASGLRYDDRPGKVSLAGAFGNFKGESGLALGLGYAATNRLRFNASVSGVPNQGSVGGTVSGSITLN